MLFQQTSTIPRVRMLNSTISEIVTEKGLWSWKSEGISEEICPLGGCNNYSYLQISLILLFRFIYL